MNLTPYVGITGFVSLEQVKTLSAVWKSVRPKESTRKLHVGVMTSYKHHHHIPHAYEKAFPLENRIAEIFDCAETYNCLHYVDYVGRPKLWETLTEIISLGGIGLHAIQLDMTWPDPTEIAKGVQASRKKVEVILQIGLKAFEAVYSDPLRLVRKLEEYEDIVQRVSLDQSMGKGRPLAPKELSRFIRAIKIAFPKMAITVAGGLGPKTVHLLGSLVKESPDLSWDAEGKLRTSGSNRDPMEVPRAVEYLRSSAEYSEVSP
ncbi:MAG TPA: hypothetical protein VFA52_01060 [Candidatus Paceibacterota bacterium]|nr:hypothetical protein [Candidatus Paceibacterota bacterium]